MLSKIKPIISLSLICVVTVLVLAVINVFTAPAIEEYQQKKTLDSLLEVMPDGGNFTPVDIEGHSKEITDIFRSENGGYVFRVKVTGYKSGLVVLCGISADGKITGAKCIESSETFGAEKILGSSYAGKDSDSYSSVPIVSGATKTSNGYKNAVKIAFEAFDKLTAGGES